MNTAAIIIGIVLMIAGFFFTIITLGFGVPCSGPMMLIGFILFIVGLVIPSNKKIVIRNETKSPKIEKSHDRYCPDCGRSIPFDANVCPYCSKKF